MTSQVMTKDPNTIRRLGFEALTEKLGPIGMIEFMCQYDSGYGDYTKDRNAWLGSMSIQDISNGIMNTRKQP